MIYKDKNPKIHSLKILVKGDVMLHHNSFP